MKNTKRILLYSPYLHILGGGERHILSILEVFDKARYGIDIVSDDKHILPKVQERLDITLANANVIDNFFRNSNPLKKLHKTQQYSHLFYVTDGSYFFSAAEKNYVFTMYPKKELYDMNFVNRLKLYNFNAISNGEFTAEYIDQWFGKSPAVIHPYIHPSFFVKKQTKREKVILSVGRFFGHLHAKRQDILIEAFKKLKKESKFEGYKLILAGGYEKEEKSVFDNLVSLAEGDPDIIFEKNPSFDKLTKLYKKATFYWHAAGYGVNETEEPYKVEHLGITPLEAMSSRLIVFSHNSGGPKKNIVDSETGFLYETKEDLVKKMLSLSLNNEAKIITDQAYDYVENNFSYSAFENNVKDYFKL